MRHRFPAHTPLPSGAAVQGKQAHTSHPHEALWVALLLTMLALLTLFVSIPGIG